LGGRVDLVRPGTLAEQLDEQRRARDAGLLDPEPGVEPRASPPSSAAQLVFDVGTTLADIEIAAVRQTLDAVNGNKAEAARLLGVDRRTIYRLLKAA
jgi:two-component system response regulator AtoC